LLLRRPNSLQEGLHYVGYLPLTEDAVLAIFCIAQFEVSHHGRPILAVGLRLFVSGEMLSKKLNTGPDDLCMLAAQLVTERLRCSLPAAWAMLDAINQVMRVFSLCAMVKRQRLEAYEADDVRARLKPEDPSRISSPGPCVTSRRAARSLVPHHHLARRDLGCGIHSHLTITPG